MHVTFLSASVPLTKTFSKSSSGVQKTPYPNAYEVTSHVERINSLGDFASAVTRRAAAGHCLLKGLLDRELVNESRAGHTDPNKPTDWLCLDFDGVDDIAIDNVLANLGITDVSYVVQWSASYKVIDKLLRAHVFVMLDKPQPPALLKQWLIQLNHEHFYQRLALTKTNNALLWPLDVSVCQNDKLIYIAPPKFKGLQDPLAKQARIEHIKKKRDRFALPVVNDPAKNTALTQAKIAELRETKGLPKKKQSFKMQGSVEVLSKPEACAVTEIKSERGFTYLNLNGGDSWGYYHPDDNPDFIYNFKGEPTYLTKELLPEYWSQITAPKTPTVKANAPSQGLIHLVFLDRLTDKYYRGAYDPATDKLNIKPTDKLKAIKDYTLANNVFLPDDVVPEWDIIFDPHDNVRVDTTNCVINIFELTPYMKAQAKPTTRVPPIIRKVIFHMCGSDQESYDRFINWLAYALQNRDRAITAWVFHGVPGTGKGTFLSKVIRPLFGLDQVAVPRMRELDKEFNSFVHRSLIVAVDEVETDALNNERGVMADLRQYITEEWVSLRRMRTDAQKVRNYACWLFFSNYSAPVRITRNDRRFNVAKYQPHKLVLSDQERDAIETELQAFHDYLLGYAVDKNKVIFPLDNQEREEMIDLSENAIDVVSNALLAGDMQWLIDQLPTSDRYISDAKFADKVTDYKATLKALLERTDRASGVCNIARDELRAIYEYTVGKIPESPNKFTSLLKHHRVRTQRIRIGNDTPYGIKTTFKDLKSWPSFLSKFDLPKTQLKRIK